MEKEVQKIIKVGRQDYMEAFLNTGEIFFDTVKSFKKKGLNQERFDEFEGAEDIKQLEWTQLPPNEDPTKFNPNLNFILNCVLNFYLADKDRGSFHKFTLQHLYSEFNRYQNISKLTRRTPNLKLKIVKKIADNLGLTFVYEKIPQPKNSSHRKGSWSKTGGVEQEIKLEYNQISNLPYLKTFRKKLRKNLTPAEAALWKMIHGKKLGDRKFRRQHSVGNYI